MIPDRPMYYRLDSNHNPVACTMMETDWSDPPRRVGMTKLGPFGRVSTIFLPLDHSWEPGPPILFETMIFGGALDQEQWRYCTWDEAAAGHRHAVRMTLVAPFVRVWSTVIGAIARKEK
jgi:hypothetical protein